MGFLSIVGRIETGMRMRETVPEYQGSRARIGTAQWIWGTRLPNLLPGLAASLLCLGALFATAARAEGDVKTGREFSIKHCTRCHVVGDANPNGGIGSTPSFQLLARRDDWRERFETFFERRPHPVFVRVPGVPPWTKLPSIVEPFTITLGEIDAIVSFIETLEQK
jgi:mono/diheme cytochrome c family protein